MAQCPFMASLLPAKLQAAPSKAKPKGPAPKGK
jgi:hypothetical protein